MGCHCRGWPVDEAAVSEIVMLEAPEGVTIGEGGELTDALPPPQPARRNGMQKIATAKRTPLEWQTTLADGPWEHAGTLTQEGEQQEKKGEQNWCGQGHARDGRNAKRRGRRQLGRAAGGDGDLEGRGVSIPHRNARRHLTDGAERSSTASESHRAGEPGFLA